MKNEVFSGKRFRTYFKYDLSAMWHNHFKAALGIGLAGLFFYVIAVLFHLIFTGRWQGPGMGGRIAVFTLAAFALELYQTRTYGYITDKRKGSAWLMIPASTFEKWLSMMIMTLIVVPLIFLAASFAVDELLVLLDPTMNESFFTSGANALGSMNQTFSELNEEYMTNWSVGKLGFLTLLSFWSSYLFFLLCGLCFRKNKILFGFLVLFGLSILSSIFTSPIVFNPNTHRDAEATDTALKTILNLSTLLSGISVAGLAAGCYYRLKTIKQ